MRFLFIFLAELVSCVKQQVHLSYYGLHTRSISWTSLTEKNTMKVFVKEPGSSTYDSFSSTVEVFTEPQLNDTFRYIHTVVLDNLDFGNYSYYVDVPNEENTVYNFEVENWETEDSNLMVVFADMGVTNAMCLPGMEQYIKTTNKYTNKNKPDLIWHVGDLAYDMFEIGGNKSDHWMNLMEPLAAETPYMTSVGNHEFHYNFTHYNSRYASQSPDGNPFFYSYDYGFVHVVHFNTEVYFYDWCWDDAARARQMEFLKEDLMKANQNREKVPWVVTLGHRPLYNLQFDWHDDPKELLRVNYEELFKDMKVDLVIAGHIHNYARSLPVFNETYEHQPLDVYTDPSFPVHVVTGAAGNWEQININGAQPPYFPVVIDDTYTWSTMEFSSTEATITQFDAFPVRPDKPLNILDIWKIRKTKNFPDQL